MKKLLNIDSGSFTFDASEGTVTISGITLEFSQILEVINITSNNLIIYTSNIEGRGGVFENNVLTLNYDTTNMTDEDELQVWYWDVSEYTELVDGKLLFNQLPDIHSEDIINIPSGNITSIDVQSALNEVDTKKIGILSTTNNIDAKVIAVTNLYTVPTGKKCIITEIIIRCTLADTITVLPTVGVGITSGEDDIFESTLLVGLNSISKVWKYITEGCFIVASDGEIIKLGVDIGSTAISQTISVDLIGYIY